MYIVQHFYKGMEHELKLFHKVDNAVRKYVELVLAKHGSLNVQTLPQKFTSTRLTEQEQEEAMVNDTIKVQDAQFYIDKPLEFALLLENVEEHQEFTDHQIIFLELNPVDLSDKENAVPELITQDDPASGCDWREYKRVKFHATSNKECNEFHKYIDKYNGDGIMQRLYRHRGWFYYQLHTGIKFHILHGVTSHSCNTQEEMHNYIDQINNA